MFSPATSSRDSGGFEDVQTRILLEVLSDSSCPFGLCLGVEVSWILAELLPDGCLDLGLQSC